MNPSDRTKEALLARTESLCNAIYDERSRDPWGGDGYLSTILRTVRMEESSEYSDYKALNDARDYYTSAQKELTIREQTAGLIKTTQDLSTLIRDLQELWLFGGLDTLEDKKDEEVVREKAGKVAEMIEVLAKGKAGAGKEIGVQEEGKKDG
ncbi:hypothetical protein EK21DRAFT_73169 [Setomelanomma holmii]|uniref:Uncharacterized protein n=1 Tax=Setomelanomma holmii TaxID=210430 RepID=A0A9P4H244_9PLEO|nr:hypothetical protein EK21DRAFT_73169 [Setomelanomma holmii]